MQLLCTCRRCIEAAARRGGESDLDLAPWPTFESTAAYLLVRITRTEVQRGAVSASRATGG